MSLNRRTFLKSSAIVGGALGLGGFPSLVHGENSPSLNADGVNEEALIEHPQPQKKLSILILGGTGFIGPKRSVSRPREAITSIGMQPSK